jgi:hypothetical protein
MRIVNGLALASLLALSACGGTTSSTESADSQYALDTGDVNNAEASVLTSSVPTTLSGVTSDAIASEVATWWGGNFTPAGCATATASGSTVTLVVNACVGPYGVLSATGTVTADITAATNGFTAKVSSTALKVNQATVDIDSTYTYSSAGGTNTLMVTAQGDATGPRGNHLTRNGSYTITWGSGCITVNGSWTANVADAKYTATVTDFAQCKGECPQAGGEIDWVGAKRTLDIKYDGSNMASVNYTGPFAKDDSKALLFCTVN